MKTMMLTDCLFLLSFLLLLLGLREAEREQICTEHHTPSFDTSHRIIDEQYADLNCRKCRIAFMLEE
jgi:hypothetical protein